MKNNNKIIDFRKSKRIKDTKLDNFKSELDNVKNPKLKKILQELIIDELKE